MSTIRPLKRAPGAPRLNFVVLRGEELTQTPQMRIQRYLAARRGNAVHFGVRLFAGRRVQQEIKAGRKPDLVRLRRNLAYLPTSTSEAP